MTVSVAIKRVQTLLKGTSIPFRTAILVLSNQKCWIYGDTVLIDKPKKCSHRLEKHGIESPTILTITGLYQ